MTSREELQIEILHLSEGEAAAVLAFIAEQRRTVASGPWPPSFAGIGRSDKHDLGARSEEILRATFGSR